VTGVAEADLVDGLIAAHDLATEVGATVVQAHVERVLGNAGIRRIDAGPARPFDAAVHLAISVERNAAATAPTIGREVRPGWSRGDAVVRPAEVVVLAP
jgi:molecular chaperone GrpE (heat shock protein)